MIIRKVNIISFIIGNESIFTKLKNKGPNNTPNIKYIIANELCGDKLFAIFFYKITKINEFNSRRHVW